MGEHLDVSVRRYLSQVVVRQVRTLCELQAENGMWHTVLDDPFSPQESSATAGIAYLGMLPFSMRSYLRLKREAESLMEPVVVAEGPRSGAA